MGMILRIASSRIVGQGDIVGRSGYFSLNLSANSVMRGRLDARRTLKSLVADLRGNKNKCIRYQAYRLDFNVAALRFMRNNSKYISVWRNLILKGTLNKRIHLQISFFTYPQSI